MCFGAIFVVVVVGGGGEADLNISTCDVSECVCVCVCVSWRVEAATSHTDEMERNSEAIVKKGQLEITYEKV